MMNILVSVLLCLCYVVCMRMQAMDKPIDPRLKLQDIITRQIKYEHKLHTALKDYTHQVKQRTYVVYALECATIFLSWYIGEPYTAGVLGVGAAAVGAFTWQLGQAVEDEQQAKNDIVHQRAYINVLHTLLAACDNNTLRQALQPRTNT